jgi:GalNAc-alpha-(1->4)-GalNAc-alpha-(1->3)-diNAcBac-PP-undecaprenol alpha-1,4-N-acetyl-D-galactosaminyltransferase
MKKILVTVPTLGAGGMERAALNFAIMLSRQNIEVKLFLISSNTISYNIPDDIDVFYGKKKVSNKLLIPISLYKLRKVTKKFKPDFVLSFSGKLSSYVILALKGVNDKVIPFHRSSPYRTYGFFNNLLNEMVFPKCKALVVQTYKAKSFFKDKYGNKNILVIPNPVREIFNDENIKKEKIILSVSRLVKGKGLKQLIDIFSKIKDKEWKLYILGKGYLRNELNQHIKELKLESQVKLLGFKQNIDYYLSLASIFAFTSESEGYPNALLEAMAAGLPCISFDCPTGPNEIIDDGVNGFLVPLGDQKQYIDKLIKLIDNKELRIKFSEEAKKLKETNSLENISNMLINGLENLLD